MNDRLKKLYIGKGETAVFEKWRTESLTSSEKSEMRLFLRKKVAALTVWARMHESVSAPFRMLSFRQALSLSAIVAIVLSSSGIGVAKASEQSLPGEALYKVKTIINEPILGLLKRTSEEKILWAKTLSERRMDEANILAVSGKLGEKESQEIEDLIEKHHEYLERYEDEDDDTFVNELDLQSEKIELKIEIKEGKKKYRIRERENQKEERDEEDERHGGLEENRPSEIEDDGKLIQKEREVEVRINIEKKKESKKKSESESVKRSGSVLNSGSENKSGSDNKNEEEKQDSSGSGSGDSDNSGESDDSSDDDSSQND